jgi:hypothetical protein
VAKVTAGTTGRHPDPRQGRKGAAVKRDDAGGDDDQRPDPSRSDRLKFVEVGLQITALYLAYRKDEAATIAVTALIEIIRLMRR